MFDLNLDANTEQLLKKYLKQILRTENLQIQRAFIETASIELGEDSTACAAALLYLLQNEDFLTHIPPTTNRNDSETIRMVRYRLDIGSKHQLILETLIDILTKESGVDKTNIHNVTIRELYTLLELPDAMPPDIFQILKTLEINSRKLNIKRVKSRHKKS